MYPCKPKAHCSVQHFIKHVSISYNLYTRPVVIQRQISPGAKLHGQIWKKSWFCKNVPRMHLIYFKPLRVHVVPLFKLSNVLPLNLLKLFENNMPNYYARCIQQRNASIQMFSTYLYLIFFKNTSIIIIPFFMACNFYQQHSRTDHLKNSFSF